MPYSIANALLSYVHPSQVEEELELQQRSFGKVLRKDRDVYEARADAAERRYIAVEL